jgi:hypothetical protein
LVGAITVELIGWLADDSCAGGARPLAMRVKPVHQMDVNGLCVLTLERYRARDEICPLTADHDVSVAGSEFHLSVPESSRGVRYHHRTFKAEGTFEPVEGGEGISVEDRRCEGRAIIGISHN